MSEELSDVSNEIKDMLEGLDSAVFDSDESQASEPEEKGLPDDAGGDDENKSTVNDEVRDPGTEPSFVPDTPVDDTKNTDTGSDVTNEFETLRAQNAALIKQIEELSRAKEVQKPAELVLGFNPEHYKEIFENLNLDNVIDAEENFKNFLLKFAQHIHTDVLNKIRPETARITQEQISRYDVMRDIRRDFYDRHKELVPVKSYVAQVSNSVAQEMPEATLAEILEETAIRVKTALNLTGLKKEEEKPTKKTPAFVQPGNAERGKVQEKIDPTKQEILDLMNF